MTLIESLRGIFSDQVDEGRREFLKLAGVTAAGVLLAACSKGQGTQMITEQTAKEKIGLPPELTPFLYFDEDGAKVLGLQTDETQAHLIGKIGRAYEIFTGKTEETIHNPREQIIEKIETTPVVNYRHNQDGSVTTVFFPNNKNNLSGDGRLVVFLDDTVTRHETYAFGHTDYKMIGRNIKVIVDYQTGKITMTTIDSDEPPDENLIPTKGTIIQEIISPPNTDPVVPGSKRFIEQFPDGINKVDPDLLKNSETAIDVLATLLLFINYGSEIPTKVINDDMTLTVVNKPLTYNGQPSNQVVIPDLSELDIMGPSWGPDRGYEYGLLMESLESLLIPLPPIGEIPRLFMVETDANGKKRVAAYAVDYAGRVKEIFPYRKTLDGDPVYPWFGDPKLDLFNPADEKEKTVKENVLEILGYSGGNKDGWNVTGLWSNEPKDLQYFLDSNGKVRLGIIVDHGGSSLAGKILIIPESLTDIVGMKLGRLFGPGLYLDENKHVSAEEILTLIDLEARRALAQGFDHLGPNAMPTTEFLWNLLSGLFSLNDIKKTPDLVSSPDEVKWLVCAKIETAVYRVEIDGGNTVYKLGDEPIGKLNIGEYVPLGEFQKIGDDWYIFSKRQDRWEEWSHYLQGLSLPEDARSDVKTLAIKFDPRKMTFIHASDLVKIIEKKGSSFGYFMSEEAKMRAKIIIELIREALKREGN